MKALTVFIGEHPVLTYFTTPARDPRFASALIAMLAGPSLTGIRLTALVRGARALE